MDNRYGRLDDLDENQPRRRNNRGVDHSDEGVYNELQRLRSLVDVIEGGDSPSGPLSCLSISLDNAKMSTIFGLVFVTIITVTIYAFHNLFRAISKRFFQNESE